MIIQLGLVKGVEGVLLPVYAFGAGMVCGPQDFLNSSTHNKKFASHIPFNYSVSVSRGKVKLLKVQAIQLNHFLNTQNNRL